MDTGFCLQVCTAFAKKEWSQELHFFREKETLLPLVWTQAPPPFLPCIDVYSLGVICGHLHILCHLFTKSLTFTLTDLWLIDLNTSVQAACFLKLIIPCLSWLGESLHSQCVSHTHTKVKKKARGGFNTGRPFSFCPIRSARKAPGGSDLDTFSCLFYAIWLGYWHSKPFGTFVSTTTQKPRANHPLKQVLKNFKR